MIRDYADLGYKLMAMPRIGTDGRIRTDPMFRSFARTPLFREYHAWVRTGDPELFAYIVNFLWFGRKAEYLNDDLVAEGAHKWLGIEEDLRKLVLPVHVVEDLRRLFLLSEFTFQPTEMFPSHGPGQVAEGLETKSVFEKNKEMTWDADSHDFLYTLITAWGDREDATGEKPQTWLLHPNPDAWDCIVKNEVVFTQLAQVPKDQGSVRFIGMEPVKKMWMQKAVSMAFKTAMARSKLGTVVDIDDQSKNQVMALSSSLKGDFDTLDQSSASDRASDELVRGIFPEHIYYWLDVSRTKYTRFFDGDKHGDIIIELKKFAGMGSDLCFPVQSAVYACVIALAYAIGQKGLSAETYLSEGMSVVDRFPVWDERTRAYGDDLIVDGKYTASVILLLQSLGLKINEKKSFVGDQAFRESCGTYALMGHDVSPTGTMFKVRGLNDDTYDSWLGLIALANAAYRKGYLGLRQGVIDCLPPGTFVEMDADSPYANQQCVIVGNAARPGERWWIRDQYNRSLMRWERWTLTATSVWTRDGSEVEKPRKADHAKMISDHLETHGDHLERYHYGVWLFKPFNTEGKGSPPRTDLKASAKAEWKWVPLS